MWQRLLLYLGRGPVYQRLWATFRERVAKAEAEFLAGQQEITAKAAAQEMDLLYEITRNFFKEG